jgi:anhydro-N-acetylmuramic acid kinase
MAAHDLASPGQPAGPHGPDGPSCNGLYLGLISGTSADGIDAALVRFGAGAGPRGCGLVAGRTYPWDPALRERLLAIGQGGALDSLDEYGSLDVRIGEAFAAAAMALLEEAGATPGQVRAIGSHGQTLRHRPHGAAGDGRHPFTLQLGDGHVIAERTGITTVSDFRRRDVAAGGQGAPLLPALHAALLRSEPAEDRAVLNLGGIANLTLLPAAAHAGAAQVTRLRHRPGQRLARCLVRASHRRSVSTGTGAFAAQRHACPR